MSWMFGVALVVVLSAALCLQPLGEYYTDKAARRLLHYDQNSGDCRVFGDSGIVDEILRELAASESPVAVIEATELTALISACGRRAWQSNRAPSAKDFPHIIYPGTKWCGTGTAAEGIDDLGVRKELDQCCRDHDLCPDDLGPGQARHNITNESPFILSHCDCNEKFRSCLKSLGTEEAGEVGKAFFSTGLFQCYQLQRPIVRCIRWAGLITQACQEYEFVETGEPTYQILDMKVF